MSVLDLATNLVCAHPASLKGVSFDKVPFGSLPCNPKDNFNPYKIDFGLATEGGEDTSGTFFSVVIGVAVFCLVAITISAIVTHFLKPHTQPSMYNAFVDPLCPPKMECYVTASPLLREHTIF